ncbi:hypothetical protein ABS858_22855 [Vibrio neptunius]|uniref:hypothetical protein n=1 Tax=Vibrio neptunius TaxID=170651 RepID=UPI003316170D
MSATLLKEVSKSSPLTTLLLLMNKRVDNKESSNRNYKDIYPILNDSLAKGYAFESEEIQGIVRILERLPAWGAKRENFRKMYLKNEYTLRKLPRDPAVFNGQGYWH